MPKRVDANQKSIVAALRDLGATILILSNVGKGCPDICVGWRGFNYLFEIKDGSKPPSARKLTEAEQAFHLMWRGQIEIITSLEEAIQYLRCST
jgi:hypothetical protein